METEDKVEIAVELIEKTDDNELVDELIDTTKPIVPYWVLRVAALSIWAVAIFLSTKLPANAQAGSTTMQGELGSVATLGLCIILFANKGMADRTNNSWMMYGGVPINKPSPLGPLRFTGWLILIAGALVIAAYVF